MATAGMKVSMIRLRLSLMMFFEFFVWGAWAVTLGTYLSKTLSFEGQQIGLIYGTTAIAAIVSPLFVGLIADRLFASERVFAVMHLIGAGLLFLASEATSFGAIYSFLLLYAICYMPTLALVNGIGFRHLQDPDRQFPFIRLFGTVGWIIAGILIGVLAIEDTAVPLKIAAATSVLLSAIGMIQPGTPPIQSETRKSIAQLLGLDALLLLKDRSFLVLFVCSILISIPLAFYYSFANLFLNETGMTNAAAKMTLGQVSEVVFMLLMPFLFTRLGAKRMIAIGMIAWVVRYGLFSAGGIHHDLVWMLFGGIVLHGICYDFFFVSGQLYANRLAPASLKNSIQGLMTLGTYGLGMLIGSIASGWVVTRFTADDGAKDWATIWQIPAVMAALVLVVFVVTFKEKSRPEAGLTPIRTQNGMPEADKE